MDRLRSPAARSALIARLLLVALCLVACGGGGSSVVQTRSPTATPSPTATATPRSTSTPSPADLVTLNPAQSTDVIGAAVGLGQGVKLHVQVVGLSSDLYLTGAQAYPSLGTTCSPNLVLNAPPGNPGDLLAIRDYLDRVSLSSLGYPIPDNGEPSSLRWASGKYAPTGAPPGNCLAALQFTNGGTAAIQIEQIGVQLTGDPIPNRYQYALIDACTTASNPGRYAILCVGGLSHAGQCADTVFIALGAEQTGAVVQGPVTLGIDRTAAASSDPSCPLPLLLQPGATQTVEIQVTGPMGPTNLIYPVVPVLTVTETNTAKTQTVALAALASRLIYADPSEFSCYGAPNGTLQREDDAVMQELTQNHACI